MDNKTIGGVVVAVIVAIAAFYFISEANDGPLENAAEDIGDAADDVADELD